MALITSASQAPCGTQDTSFPFRAGLLPARVRKKKKAKLLFAERQVGGCAWSSTSALHRQGAPPAGAGLESWRHLAS